MCYICYRLPLNVCPPVFDSVCRLSAYILSGSSFSIALLYKKVFTCLSLFMMVREGGGGLYVLTFFFRLFNEIVLYFTL